MDFTITESVSIFIKFIGSLGLFIYGMSVMSAGLQKSAGNKMKKMLGILTKTKLMGVLVGALVTGIIQSSSATTVMVVGFVNAGLMNLTQSVGVIMGANIGTTVTAWMVSIMEWVQIGGEAGFDVSILFTPVSIASIATAVGATMIMVSKKEHIRQIGEIVVGLGVLFMGMFLMTESLVPLRSSDFFNTLFVTLGNNPILGILAGAAITALIQSSSASVGILQSLAFSGLINWSAAVYIIMGQNIGTCVTALISSIGTSKNARASAYIHLLFNVIGTVVFGALAIIFFELLRPDAGTALITMTSISVVHTIFNISNTVIVYPFSNQLVKLAEKLSNLGKAEPSIEDVLHLDDRMLANPVFAIQSSIKEITRLARMAFDNLNLSTKALSEADRELFETVYAQEKAIDVLDKRITEYLVKIYNKDLTDDENKLTTRLLHTVNDIERIGDHCENIAELAQYMIDEGVVFSETAQTELAEIVQSTKSCFELSILTLENDDATLVPKVKEIEESIDVLEKKLRDKHIKRLVENSCNPSAGVIFLEVISNLERVSDHSKNIAQAVLK